MFGSDEGITLSSDVGEGLGSTLGLDEGEYLRSSYGCLMVSMMSHLRFNFLRTHLDHIMELYWAPLRELKMRAQNWEYHLDILRVRRLAMRKAWYLDLLKCLAI